MGDFRAEAGKVQGQLKYLVPESKDVQKNDMKMLKEHRNQLMGFPLAQSGKI